ncbi:MAG: asparaginase [Planctomycetota bacterium]|nr:asparaginase [Planctomycetota bacterium]
MTDTVLANVTRDGVVDCSHRGSWALCSPSGELLFCGGDPDKRYYVRSSVKPFQTLAVIMSGAATRFGFSDEEACRNDRFA